MTARDQSVRWENPPRPNYGGGAPRNHGRDTPAWVAELKARPGQWAIVRTLRTPSSAAVYAARIRDGALPAYQPAGVFEAVSRVVEGECRVYARYVASGGAS